VTEPGIGLRLKVLAVLVVVMFAALTTRLWFLQVLAAERFRSEAKDNAVRLVEVPAPRGLIRDINGTPLVDNKLRLVVTVNQQELGDDAERVLMRLSELLDIPAEELGARLDDALKRYYIFTPVPLVVGVAKPVALYIKEHHDELPGVDVLKLPIRRYPLGSVGAHVLGYLGQISPQKLRDPAFAGYKAGDLVGISGVEGVYEHDLAGTPGLTKYRVNSLGQNLGEIGEQKPKPGNDVVLTIDADTQQLAEQSLRAGIMHARTVIESEGALIANAGAAVVLDPDTGAIQAMASFPSFDPSLFTRSMSSREYKRRFGESQSSPLLNRAIAGQYPPGSTYKPFIAASALQRGIVTTSRYYPCPGSWTAPYNTSDPAATQYIFDNWTSANLGSMNIATALAKSCDTIFYPMGYQYWDSYYVNADEAARGMVSHLPLERDLRNFGFGAPTRVDLPYEDDGRVPDPQWKRTMHQTYPDSFPEGEWFPGDFILMTIGQGDTLVTPLQLATAYGALDDDGKVCVPHVLDHVQSPDGTLVRRYQPNCRRTVHIDPKYIHYIHDGLKGTVTTPGATATAAFAGFPFSQVSVAGKTGTAQVPPKQDFSWFAGMTEANGERHVVVVLVEQGGHGATTAAPIARNIIEGLYGLPLTQFVDVAGTD